MENTYTVRVKECVMGRVWCGRELILPGRVRHFMKWGIAAVLMALSVACGGEVVETEAALCGDGVMNTDAEECDDGNTDSADLCVECKWLGAEADRPIRQ